MLVSDFAYFLKQNDVMKYFERIWSEALKCRFQKQVDGIEMLQKVIST